MKERVDRMRLWLILAVMVLAALGCAKKIEIPPVPTAEKKTHETTVHGVTLTDDYFWLREKDDPKVAEYLITENTYTDAVMQHTVKLQDKLFKEMKARIAEDDYSVPVQEGDYFYYTRYEKGKQYAYHCRKKGSVDAPEEIILDENELAKGKDYFDVRIFDVSPDHTLLAYTVDYDGSENYKLFVKDLKTGKLFDDTRDTIGSFQWANKDNYFFYTVYDAAKRPSRLFRHQLGTDMSKDTLVYEEKDERYWMWIDKTKSAEYLIIGTASKMTSEMRFLRADDPQGTFALIEARRQGVEYYLSHHGDKFYFITNDNAPTYKVVVAPVSDPKRSNWKDFIPCDPNVTINSIEEFSKFIVVETRKDALNHLTVYTDDATGTYEVPFDEPVYSITVTGNKDYTLDTLRFSYVSLVTPDTVFDFNLISKVKKVMKNRICKGYDPTLYTSDRINATAPDGTLVPISLVYKKGTKLDGTAPLYLTSYGSYGEPSDVYFSSSRLSLLNRGFVWAVAHIRGGGDKGKKWYDDGKLLNKKNTFTDFIACAEQLIAQKYTSADRLAIEGGSAGGLLMGAVANMRPDLFKVVIADVPFVDVVNTMLDASLPLTVGEYEEWGNPQEKKYFDYIRSYSPYDNVKKQAYPNMLITAGFNDPRVSYWEPAKFTLKLRDNNTANTKILLKTNMGSGHMGSTGRYDFLKDISFSYAFIFDTLGITK